MGSRRFARHILTRRSPGQALSDDPSGRMESCLISMTSHENVQCIVLLGYSTDSQDAILRSFFVNFSSIV